MSFKDCIFILVVLLREKLSKELSNSVIWQIFIKCLLWYLRIKAMSKILKPEWKSWSQRRIRPQMSYYSFLPRTFFFPTCLSSLKENVALSLFFFDGYTSKWKTRVWQLSDAFMINLNKENWRSKPKNLINRVASCCFKSLFCLLLFSYWTSFKFDCHGSFIKIR